MASSRPSEPFIIVPGDKHSEVSRTLNEPVPQALGLIDQFGLWGNLGVSLLGFTGAIFVLQPNGTGTPELSLAAALAAIVLGTILGTLAVAATGAAGARTGAPAMVLLRSLFGTKLSYLPTVLNVLQCLGWGVFELVTIATAAHTVAPEAPRWIYIVVAGALTGLLTLRPLGAIRTLRRFATPAVLVILAYLLVELLAHPRPSLGHGAWTGYWAAMDTVVAAAISFAPMAADYTRHARSPRSAFAGAFVGYSTTQIICYVIGLISLVTVARNPSDIYGAFIAVPFGSLCFAVLVARELDQSFANVYSTAVSVQNIGPTWDRRVLALSIASVATALALWLNIADYENFLDLLGSVFIPMSAVFIVDFYVLARGNWDHASHVRPRFAVLGAWVLGFVVYQLINPGYISWWVSLWTRLAALMHFHAPSWMSASITSFVVAALATLATGGLTRHIRRPGTTDALPERAAPRSAMPGGHLVHGMARDLVAADWPDLTEDEVRAVLSRFGRADRAAASGDVRITWSSPRPMSAASLIDCASGELFVKRHHVSVRSPERLRTEHAFARHLRDRGQPVPRVLAASDGDTVVRDGDFVYEVHEKAAGLDLYRDAPSWYPFNSRDHARAAGRALARFHEAAVSFAAPATAPGVLTNSMDLTASGNPLAEFHRLVNARPALARALESRDIELDFCRFLQPGIELAAPLMRQLPSQWAHGDWHPSNLTWTTADSSASVASVFDLGLANRTSAMHDLALALERSVIDWLDRAHSGDIRADLRAADAFLDGYESVRALNEHESAALIAVLPVVHVEFALSEVEYFFDVVHSDANTDLARDEYLIGHARWFHEARGAELIAHLQRRWGGTKSSRHAPRSNEANSDAR
jgi:putative hydroxymethylpyrimidine transporter CytX